MYDDFTVFLIALLILGFTILIVSLVHLYLRRNINWVCLAAAFVTKQQINKKRAILGYSGERSLSYKKVTHKKQEVYHGKGTSEMRYYLCYQEEKEICTDVRFEDWIFVNEGENAPVVRVAGDDRAYHPQGLYTDEGNRWLDRVFFNLELLGALIFLLKIIFPRFLSLARFNKTENISILEK